MSRFAVLGAIWSDALRYGRFTTEPRRFMSMYRAMPGRRTAVQLAEAETTIVVPAIETPEPDTSEPQ